MDVLNYFLLFTLAFTAGFVDSAVGGGGLIQLPALLIFFPGLPTPVVMGINKFATFSGMSVSSIRYLKLTNFSWKPILPAILMALLFSFIGARAMSSMDKEYLELIILTLLILVVLIVFAKKDLGLRHDPRLSQFQTVIYSSLTGIAIGFYDGFFGPGSGSFLILIFVTLFGFNFLMSSASAKLVNCATGISALIYFMFTGQISYQIAIPVALFNMAGAFIGTHFAVKNGSYFVRKLFLVMVVVLVAKLGFDLLRNDSGKTEIDQTSQNHTRENQFQSTFFTIRQPDVEQNLSKK